MESPFENPYSDLPYVCYRNQFFVGGSKWGMCGRDYYNWLCSISTRFERAWRTQDMVERKLNWTINF